MHNLGFHLTSPGSHVERRSSRGPRVLRVSGPTSLQDLARAAPLARLAPDGLELPVPLEDAQVPYVQFVRLCGVEVWVCVGDLGHPPAEGIPLLGQGGQPLGARHAVLDGGDTRGHARLDLPKAQGVLPPLHGFGEAEAEDRRVQAEVAQAREQPPGPEWTDLHVVLQDHEPVLRGDGGVGRQPHAHRSTGLVLLHVIQAPVGPAEPFDHGGRLPVQHPASGHVLPHDEVHAPPRLVLGAVQGQEEALQAPGTVAGQDHDGDTRGVHRDRGFLQEGFGHPACLALLDMPGSPGWGLRGGLGPHKVPDLRDEHEGAGEQDTQRAHHVVPQVHPQPGIQVLQGHGVHHPPDTFFARRHAEPLNTLHTVSVAIHSLTALHWATM
eukprot:729639-Hanusia_phi.AAC.2